jgi:hypothetical protein
MPTKLVFLPAKKTAPVGQPSVRLTNMRMGRLRLRQRADVKLSYWDSTALPIFVLAGHRHLWSIWHVSERKAETCPGARRSRAYYSHSVCFVCGSRLHQHLQRPRRLTAPHNSPLARLIRFGVWYGYFSEWTLRLLCLPATYLLAETDPFRSSLEHIDHDPTSPQLDFIQLRYISGEDSCCTGIRCGLFLREGGFTFSSEPCPIIDDTEDTEVAAMSL